MTFSIMILILMDLICYIQHNRLDWNTQHMKLSMTVLIVTFSTMTLRITTQSIMNLIALIITELIVTHSITDSDATLSITNLIVNLSLMG